MNDLDTQMKRAFLDALKQRTRTGVQKTPVQIVLPTGVVNSDELNRVLRALEQQTKTQGGVIKN